MKNFTYLSLFLISFFIVFCIGFMLLVPGCTGDNSAPTPVTPTVTYKPLPASVLTTPKSSATPAPIIQKPAPQAQTPVIPLISKPSSAPTQVPSAPSTPVSDYQKQIDELKGQIAGYVALQANYNTLKESYNKTVIDIQQLKILVLQLQGQLNLSPTFGAIVRDGVEFRTLNLNGSIASLKANQSSYSELAFRLVNNSGKKLSGIDIAGEIKSDKLLTGLNNGFPTMLDFSNGNINYHASWDGNNRVTFEVYGMGLDNGQSIDFRPRIILQSPSDVNQIYNFTLQVNNFTFLEK